jgi:hypothetical protein
MSMRVIVFVKATQNSEAGAPPGQELFEQMTRYNEELVKAGIMKSGDGLQPSRRGKRIVFDGSEPTVVDGPFAETKELVAGFWVWKVKSMEEAVEWARRCPNPMPGETGVLEIRPVYELEDFGEALTPELRERQDAMTEQIAKQTAK